MVYKKSASFIRYRPAFITSCLNLGGSTTFLLNLARGFTQENIDFRIASLEAENPLKSDFRPFSKKMLVLNHHVKIFEDRVAEVLKFISAFQATHVVACLGPSSLEVLRYVPTGIVRIGLIQSNEPGPYQSLQNYQSYLDAIGAVSLEILKRLKQNNGFRKKLLGDVRYGVQVPSQGITRSKQFGRGPKKLLYCGRIIEEQKRISLLPRILRDLDQLKVDYKFSLAGDGPDLKKMTQALMPWTSTGRVKILGRLSQDQVKMILGAHEIYLLFSDYEGLPISLLEAMGHGLVPVVSDLGVDFQNLVRGTGCKLVRSDSPKKYAETAAALCGDKIDLIKISNKCRQRIKNSYSLESMNFRWKEFLRKTSCLKNEKTEWPKCPKIYPPLPYSKNLAYLPIFRPARRALKKLNALKNFFRETSPT